MRIKDTDVEKNAVVPFATLPLYLKPYTREDIILNATQKLKKPYKKTLSYTIQKPVGLSLTFANSRHSDTFWST